MTPKPMTLSLSEEAALNAYKMESNPKLKELYGLQRELLELKREYHLLDARWRDLDRRIDVACR